MSGKFWDMYKGKPSYDKFDKEDEDVVEGLGVPEERKAGKRRVRNMLFLGTVEDGVQLIHASEACFGADHAGTAIYFV